MTQSQKFTPPGPLNTAVLFLVFNRPDVTAQVFEAIRQAKPPRLYVAADGPRTDRPGEADRCEEVRRISTRVDWPCEVKTLFRETNLGCKLGVSEGINWFFENEEEGIILEDDCLPAQSFFWFCEELLQRYRNDTRVWQISGTVFFKDSITPGDADYFFSRYGPIWGWASWRRAWQYYDPDLKNWPEMSLADVMDNVYPHKGEISAKFNLGKRLAIGELDTWDYQWGFAKNYNNALTIIPKRNQIINIGFGAEATHTFSVDKKAPTTLEQIPRPIRHPNFMIPDRKYDLAYARANFAKRNFALRVFSRLVHSLGL